jgi:hypothetical protein
MVNICSDYDLLRYDAAKSYRKFMLLRSSLLHFEIKPGDGDIVFLRKVSIH